MNKLTELVSSRLINIDSNFKFSLLIYAKRVSQLVYIKLMDFEQEQVIKGKNDDSIISEESSESENERFNSLKKELLNLEKESKNSKKVKLNIINQELDAWRKEAKKLERMLKRPNKSVKALSDIVSEIISVKNTDEV